MDAYIKTNYTTDRMVLVGSGGVDHAELVKLADIGNAQMVAMPDGPAADARDDDMRHTIEELDEGTMKAQFEEIAEIFLYDAGDAAEEWCVNWGRFSQTARAQPSAA